MNFKTLSVLSTALALSTVAGVSTFSFPAQAFTLTGENTLALSGRARFNTTTGLLNFRDLGSSAYNTSTGIAIVTPSSSGRFEALLGELATITDITLTSQGGDVWEYTGPTLTNFITVDTVGFSLSVFRLVRNPGSEWLATVEGRFQDVDLPALGEFDPLQDNLFARTTETGNGSSYSFDIEEVPSPALLPGLIGLGVTVLQRKKEETEENT